ncbi:MAG: CRISPR-associated protein Cas4 [Clostridium sp.]|nr:CRISPR-associated protein Cas4 [Clostridium sp.]
MVDVDYKLITGTLIQSFTICRRQTWLMAHQIIPDQEHQYIELGRLIDEKSYNREKKRIHFENIVIDLVRSNKGDLVIGEVKKSSKAAKSAKLQLAFYLYRLKQKGIEGKGLLLFPKERKRETVELTTELERELEKMFTKIYLLILEQTPPAVERINFCKNCAYRELCFS